MATVFTGPKVMRVSRRPRSVRVEHMTHFLTVRDAQEAKALFKPDLIDTLCRAFWPEAKPTRPNGLSATIRVRRDMRNNVVIERHSDGHRHYVTVPSLKAYLVIREHLLAAFGIP